MHRSSSSYARSMSRLIKFYLVEVVSNRAYAEQLDLPIGVLRVLHPPDSLTAFGKLCIALGVEVSQ